MNFLKNFAAKNIPLHFACELTHSCNQKCAHCFQKDGGAPVLGLEQWKRVLEQLRDAGTIYLQVTGGEPMLHPDFWAVCEYAKENLFALWLSTNGTLIGREEARRISEIGFQTVRISLYGATAETHDRMSRAAGSHDKVIRAAELLLSHGQKTQFAAPITRLNFHEIEAIWKIMKKYGMIPDVSLLIFPSLKGRNNADLRLDDKEMASVLRWLESVGHCLKCSEQSEAVCTLCNAGRLTGAVSPYGDVIPCVSMPFSAGNLLEKPFKQIWWDSPELEKIRNTTREDVECGGCGLNNVCSKCMAYGYIDTGKYPYLSTEICRVRSLSQGDRLHGKARKAS